MPPSMHVECGKERNEPFPNHEHEAEQIMINGPCELSFHLI